MKATKLIGKRAIRTKPVDYCNGHIDNSYTDEGIKIINATENHIVFESNIGREFNKPMIRVLNYLWCDDNWVDYDQLFDFKKEVSNE